MAQSDKDLVDRLISGSEKLGHIAGTATFVAALIMGAAVGFHYAGIGGAILGIVGGLLVGYLAGVLVAGFFSEGGCLLVVLIGIGISVLALFILVVGSLWDVGAP
jgi:hypothetical protein